MGDFAKQTEAKYENGAIRFYLGTGAERRQFEISGDALLQAFEAQDETASALLEAFDKGRDRITEVALSTVNTPSTDGIIELGSGDFEALNDRGGISPGERSPD